MFRVDHVNFIRLPVESQSTAQLLSKDDNEYKMQVW
jgi:hypothetical protein